ncbi:cell division control protein 16 [Melanomma pulvis-pyrius CBS 109.77]|uniref:Cell division control protein 16 n=1 Tax=Melanomma pulvis-pyrius CBS 109.77 TaxID=1314802 RepID=A0A6A6XNY1_9PLEO|nr:cell division control protein 16 [Melanomma pulvis-pyrius CBS 109.77]
MTNLDQLLSRGSLTGHPEEGLNELRYTILTQGIPANSEGMSELRMYIWLILLNAPPLRTDVYLDLVRQGASPAHAKIQNDTFRTFQGDPLFRRRVTQNSITRVLNAVAWRLNDAHEARVNGWQSPPTLSEFGGSPDTSKMSRYSFTTSNRGDTSTTNDAEQIGYVQGMNVLCGPFLYASRSEVEAFTGFEKLITQECPGYVRGSMEGVHKGLALVDRVLNVVDAKLFTHLINNQMEAKIYAFASVLTMSACTPPLPEVLQLWDFLFAYGPHLNILCIVAQLVLIRDQLLDSPSPNQILRSLPSLNASRIIRVAMTFASKIPEDMYEEIINHAK